MMIVECFKIKKHVSTDNAEDPVFQEFGGCLLASRGVVEVVC